MSLLCMRSSRSDCSDSALASLSRVTSRQTTMPPRALRPSPRMGRPVTLTRRPVGVSGLRTNISTSSED